MNTNRLKNFILFLFLIFFSFLIGISEAKAAICYCANDNWTHISRTIVGERVTVASDDDCNQECANRQAKYYSYPNDPNVADIVGYKLVTKTAAAPTAAAQATAATGTATPTAATTPGAYTYNPMEEIPGFGRPSDFPGYLMAVYKFGLWIVGISAMLMISIGGYMYLTSAGNNAAMGTAKKIITDAIAGLILALVSWILLYAINPELVEFRTAPSNTQNTQNQ